MARRALVGQRQSRDDSRTPSADFACLRRAELQNQLTSRMQAPKLPYHSIKSGGGTGPAMPRQPVPRNAERPGANSRFEEFSDKDGESVDLVTLATLGGMKQK
jgi:hypothetical protein